MFHLRTAAPDEPGGVVYTVDVDFFDFSSYSGAYRVNVYRNGAHHAYADLPASFPVEGGQIEAAASFAGLKRIHYVPQGASAKDGQLLTPDPQSGEGLRAALGRRAPALSRWLGRAAVAILITALLLGLPQTVEAVTAIPWAAENLGTFESPLHLPAWANTTLVVAAALAVVERALTMRHHWLLDGDAGLWDE